jgi:filamentous hemagglutinin family protein
VLLALIVGSSVTALPQSSIEAGDILRGGSAATASSAVDRSPGSAISPGLPSGLAPGDSLARTTRALQAVQAMQNAAHNAARNGPNNLGVDPNHPTLRLPEVPNGLVVGGLQVAPHVPANLMHPNAGEDPALWRGANLPTQVATLTGQTDVNITQTAQQALLTWETFNIGKNTTLTFDQSAGGANVGQWIAFNRVIDPSGIPSQILGSISALGQVYVLNQNGIIFGGSAQVNVHALVASSVPINDNLLTQGLLNNPDDQFLFSSLVIPVLPSGGRMPEFDPPPPPNTPSGRAGDVIVQMGALLSSPSSPDHVGGRIALIGPNVSNAGTISTPDGQTILAAGQQVAFSPHSSDDPSLRGVDVFVGAVDAFSGTATNAGLIESPRADVTLAGKEVNQLGVIQSTTSVALNGRIDLMANYDTQVALVLGVPHFNPSASGIVTFGAGSVTEVLPELTSSERVIGTQLALSSQVNAQGLAIHMADNSLLVAPSANVTMNAGTWLPSPDGFAFTLSTGQIYLDQGSLIDVSGSRDVAASVAENFIPVELRATELANSPLQRNGPLHGQTIEIDIRQHGPFDPTLNNGKGGYTWVGTPLADASGYVALVKRSVGELTIAGGTVTLNAGESVVMQLGSAIDVSAGWIDYSGALVQTTRLVSGGQIFDISQATPDRIYSGIAGGFTVTHPRWGITETSMNPFSSDQHFEPSYIQGGDGGAILLTAPAMALDGQLRGNTIPSSTTQSVVSAPSSLSLTFQAQHSDAPPFNPFSPTPPNIVFAQGVLPVAAPFLLDPAGNPIGLRADRREQLFISPDLINPAGFADFQLENSDGNITLPAGTTLNAGAGGSISLAGANVDIEGHISAPGGNLSFTASDISPYTLIELRNTPGAQTPPADPTRGNFVLGAAASVTTAGQIIDGRSQTTIAPALFTAGGTVTIKGYDAKLLPDSSIDVSGGVSVDVSGAPTFGNGGSIVINAGQDPNIASVVGGHLDLSADLRGFAGNSHGGSLSVLAPLIQIGGAATHDDTLLLSPEFFNQGGFSSFSLGALGLRDAGSNNFVPAISVALGAALAPQVKSWIADTRASSVVLTTDVVPEAFRPPVTLSLNAIGVRDVFSGVLLVRGDLLLGKGVSISAGPLGSVSLTGDTVAELGSITAPGGSISISGAQNSIGLFGTDSQALATVDIAPGSVLSVAGALLPVANSRGFQTGTILPGGSITISGNIVTEASAVLDVSGASADLDVPTAFNGAATSDNPLGAQIARTHVESNAGSISFRGGQELFTDATLFGRAGGPSASGGSLSVACGRFYTASAASSATPLDVTMVVTQNGPSIPASFKLSGANVVGQPIGDSASPGLGHFVAATIDRGGFGSLSLKGTLQFSGNVALSLDRQISVADAGVLFADGTVSLNAPYIALGKAFQPPIPPEQVVPPFTVGDQPFYFSPAFGSGHFSANAKLIDIGNLSLQNIGTAAFTANNGDIRGDGTLDVAGSISMTAGQIYTPTEVSFTIAAFDYSNNGANAAGSVAIHSAGERPLPLSAGGQLNVYASVINQDGVLRAPLGSINVGTGILGAAPTDPISNTPFATAQQIALGPHSISSVSAFDPVSGRDLTIPYGTNLNGTTWIDPSGFDITSAGPPSKNVNVSGVNVTDQAGSLLDLRGGGDLYAYRFVSGTGGTHDILASTSSFAVTPGYQLDYSPFAPDYSGLPLSVGDRVYLSGSSALPAGVYTILPARYALLPGAFLVTPENGVPPAGGLEPDGSSIVAGYRFNDLNQKPSATVPQSLFEVAPSAVVRSRAHYENFSANTFLRQGALAHDVSVPRLPIDSGQLVLAGTDLMSLDGNVESRAPAGGIGGEVDISSPNLILIATSGGGPGVLRLDPNSLTAFGADSLLIGGYRRFGPEGTSVTVQTSTMIVDNAGAPLAAPEVILAATQTLSLSPGADVEQRGTLSSPADVLLLGDAGVQASGDGVLLRISSDPNAIISRTSVSSSRLPLLVVGADTRLTGESITLDSTSGTVFDPRAGLFGSHVSLGAGLIDVVLSGAGPANGGTALVLSGAELRDLQASAQSLSLLSYSSIDLYGSGQLGEVGGDGLPIANSLALHAAEVQGIDNVGGRVLLAAKQITLDNSPGLAPPSPCTSDGSGILELRAETIQLGANQVELADFANTILTATKGVVALSTGALVVANNLTIQAPVIIGTTAAHESISADGALALLASNTAPSSQPVAGLGSFLSFQGSTIFADATILAPSGWVALRATTYDLAVAGRIDAAGTVQSFFDLQKFTDGGQVSLTSDNGNVNILQSASVTVAAQLGAGNGGTLSIGAPRGGLALDGTIAGAGGRGGNEGSFSLDIGALPTFASLAQKLETGSFTQALSVRVRNGNVLLDGRTSAHTFDLSSDTGSINITGVVDASGREGGTIGLQAFSDVTLAPGSELTVAGQQLNAAGKGGAVSLETTSGRIFVESGSKIDLSISGSVGGTLHLRAPQLADTTDLAIDPIAGNILNGSSIVAEGFFVQDANTPGSAAIDDFTAAALANATAFMSNSAAIQSRLIGGNQGFANIFHVQPGEEIRNSSGDLVLNNDLDLSTWRFGVRKPVVDASGQPLLDANGNPILAGVEPGILTLRAAGSIILHGFISDGFGDSAGDVPIDPSTGLPAPWLATLLPRFADGTSQQSWSYRIVAGADLSAADYSRVQPLNVLAAGSGSLLLGVDGGPNISNPFGPGASSATALTGHYQVIRTGTGDIDVFAAGDVKLLNDFATIYTAGTQVSDPTLGGRFDLPRLFADAQGAFPLYPAQYSYDGGNVTISAQNDIIHQTIGPSGTLTAASDRELPTNWLYRRGFVDPATGQFGASIFGEIASTSWWVDFSNFFEGVGALGGGNVTLTAGHDVSNVDAVIPTNARAPKGVPDPSKLVELGGGNLLVQAGHDIDAGVYYVERGNGIILAGNTIHTNATRSPSLTDITQEDPYPSETWLPTTLFLGKGTFTVRAVGDISLGPVANPFILPPGAGNSFWYKTYFSTYAPGDSVDVASLTRTVNLREGATLPNGGVGQMIPMLLAWIQSQSLLTQDGTTAAFYQPWLITAETDVSPFFTAVQIMPPTLRATAFSSDVNVVGNLTLASSAVGTIDLAAAHAINGLQVSGQTTINNVVSNAWSAATINLSDSGPALLPSVASPFALQSVVGTDPFLPTQTPSDLLVSIDRLFAESGSSQGTYGVLQTKQALHAAGLLHYNDPNPIHLYAATGDISGLTVFSAKPARIITGRDLTDVAFYIQNLHPTDLTLVVTGRDLTAYDPNSSLRAAAQAPGNALTFDSANALAGDVQINGPGTLEVIAGRNLDLGVGQNNPDGTGVGITSVGNARNPYLPFGGADLFVGAGIGLSQGLNESRLDFASFVSEFLNPAAQNSARYLPELGELLGLDQADNNRIWASYQQLAPFRQATLALEIFYRVLRDAGRDHNNPSSPGFGNYNAAIQAVTALFPGENWLGDLSLTSREIKTTNGGNISIFAPGGSVNVGVDLGENQPVDQGILTAHGGDIAIFTKGSVNVGTSRIFTLRGGDEIIYSSEGDIAAGASSKTVLAAPPTRVLIDPQSADVETDLSGLATGGGIGVLATVAGVPPGDVDLIAPTGTINAGEAGIRVSGNLNLAALQVLNASNIQVAGTSTGVPVISLPNVGSLTAASNAVAAATNPVAAAQQAQEQTTPQEIPSLITVEVIGYGGGDTDQGNGADDEERRRKRL